MDHEIVETAFPFSSGFLECFYQALRHVAYKPVNSRQLQIHDYYAVCYSEAKISHQICLRRSEETPAHSEFPTY